MKNLFDPKLVKITRNVVYGSQIVGYTSTKVRRELLMDVYEPVIETDAGVRPAVILAFGGAFHRGSKECDSFSVGALSNTSAADYAAYWAANGFVCFCIDYRLTQEDPVPGTTRALSSYDSVAPDRMHAVRAMLGLPPATLEMLANGVEAAADDVALATRFVQTQSQQWRVCPDRIALWGWSAGARSALNAVFTEGVTVSAVVAASGYMHADDLRRNVLDNRSGPDLMLIFGERDWPHMLKQAPDMISFLRSRLPYVAGVFLPNVDHFYPATTSMERGGAESLIACITGFLRQRLM